MNDPFMNFSVPRFANALRGGESAFAISAFEGRLITLRKIKKREGGSFRLSPL